MKELSLPPPEQDRAEQTHSNKQYLLMRPWETVQDGGHAGLLNPAGVHSHPHSISDLLGGCAKDLPSLGFILLCQV